VCGHAVKLVAADIKTAQVSYPERRAPRMNFATFLHADFKAGLPAQADISPSKDDVADATKTDALNFRNNSN
jgi:hypothetical protein